MKDIPENIQEVLKVYGSLDQLMKKSDYYENIDGLEEGEKLNRLYEYRNKLFSLLKKTQAIEYIDTSFEPVRKTVVNLLLKILNWSEKKLIREMGTSDLPSDDEYKEMCMQYVVENAYLFYKLRVSDDYPSFLDRWRWVLDRITENHTKSDRKNNHTRLLSGDDYQISSEDLEYIVGKYVIEDVNGCLQKKCSRFVSDKKEAESRKKLIVSELKEKYPNATGNCKSFLLSGRNWNALCKDFLEEEKQSILNKIRESNISSNSKSAVTFIVILSVFLNSYLDSGNLEKKFEDYILMRTENEFILAEQKKNVKLLKQGEQKSNNKVKCNVEHKIIPQKRDLPLGMEDEIKKLDIIDDRQLIKFFRNELTKFGGYIKMSHLRDRLNRMSEIESLSDVLALLDNYPEFIIEDDEENITEKKAPFDGDLRNKEIIRNVSDEKLLLNKLSEIINKSNIEERLSGYIDIFEELGFKFKDREDFLFQLKNAIDRTEKLCLEKSIQTALKFRIYGNESLSKKKAFGYRAICLNHRAWRIVLTNMEITHILPHSEYEKLINTKPSK